MGYKRRGTQAKRDFAGHSPHLDMASCRQYCGGDPVLWIRPDPGFSCTQSVSENGGRWIEAHLRPAELYFRGDRIIQVVGNAEGRRQSPWAEQRSTSRTTASNTSIVTSNGAHQCDVA